MLPKTMASVGQACWHAVRISPSMISRSSFSDAMRASLMRWTQYVHFSITPRLRTVTSGLRIIFRLGESKSANRKKLNRRTLYGQLLEQYRVPTQRLYTMSFRPSVECVVAPTGQTGSHGAFSHCMQLTGWN